MSKLNSRLSLLILLVIMSAVLVSGCSAENMILDKAKQRVNQFLNSADLLAIAGAAAFAIRKFIEGRIKNEQVRKMAEPVLIGVEKKGRDLILWLLTQGRDGLKDFVKDFDHRKPLKGQLETWIVDEINKIKKTEAGFLLGQEGAAPAEAEKMIEVIAPKMSAPALAEKADPGKIARPEFRSPEAQRLIEELRARISK